MHSRHLRPVSVRRLPSFGTSWLGIRARRVTIVLATGILLIAPAPAARAQRSDSARVAARPTATDSIRRAALPKPPLSPRRAFLYSLALPGYSQSVLNRPTAGALFLVTETIALAMLRESAADLRQARRFRTDSLVVIGYEPTGTPITLESAYNQELIDIRRGHVEDWIAFLIANHLFAAADAYVGAHLWDLPTQISVEARPTGAVVAARLHW